MNRHGHTLVELMVALALASLVSLGVITLYARQSGLERQEARAVAARQEAGYVHDLIAGLLRQARLDSLHLVAPDTPPDPLRPEGETDRLIVDFRLPEGIPIWPNQDGARPWVRLSWSAADGRPSLTTAASRAELAIRPSRTLSLLHPDARLLDLDLWPLAAPDRLQPTADAPATAGYLLAVAIRGGDPHRPYVLTGVVSPRN